MKNDTDRQIPRLSLPSKLCFNFFDTPHKNFEITDPNRTPCQSHTSQHYNQSFVKECNFAGKYKKYF